MCRSQDERLRAGDVDHGRRGPGKLAAVDERRGRLPELRGHVGERARIGLARQVRARCDERADPVEQLAGDALDGGDADADRVAARAGQPREPLAGVRDDQRVGARERACGRLGKIGKQPAQHLEAGGNERCRLLDLAALGVVERPNRRLQVRRRREAVDRVGRDDRELAVPDRCDCSVDVSHAVLRRRGRGLRGRTS
jgi:hypothetical protein